jgi:hypothetical protein
MIFGSVATSEARPSSNAGRRAVKSAVVVGAKSINAPAVKEDDGSYRAKSGNLDLYLPPSFEAVDGKYDVVLHFHGIAKAQESNAKAANLNAAIVSINLGIVADKYGKAFMAPGSFDKLLNRADRMVAASGKANGAKPGRVALSAWSAGFGSVGQILKQDSAKQKVDAVFLADGLHAAYSDTKKHTIDEHGLVKFARLSEEAERGEKLFVITHSSIPTYGYANVTESVGTVLKLASLEKEAPPSSSPRNMHALYTVNKGDLHITGYEGHGVADHIDHIWAMGQTMFPFLATRWSKK